LSYFYVKLMYLSLFSLILNITLLLVSFMFLLVLLYWSPTVDQATYLLTYLLLETLYILSYF